MCDAEAGDHEDACTGSAPCPVAWDWVVTCNNPQLGPAVFQVAATSDEAFVGGSDSGRTWLWSFDAGGWSEVADPPPLLNGGSPIALGVAPDETLFVLSHEPQGVATASSFPSRLSLLTLTGDSLGKSTVNDPDETEPRFRDFAVAPDGGPHVWYVNPPDARVWARLDGDAWKQQLVEPSGAEFQRFSLSETGEPVEFRWELDGSSHQVSAEFGGIVTALGRSHDEYFSFRPIDPAMPVPSTREPVSLAAAIQQPDGLELVWVSDGTTREALLSEAAPLQRECEVGILWWQAHCPATPCREQASGLEREAYAATIGESDIWVAYLIEHGDFDVTYTTPIIEGRPTCVGNQVSPEDRSRTELVVVRVPLDGAAPAETLRVEVGSPTRTGLVLEYGDQSPVAIHAFGPRVAVAARAFWQGTTRIRQLLLEPPAAD